jgi:nitrogen fixation NifU-like protein
MDLRELYQEVILDHNRRPRNFGNLDNANCSAEGYNPLCGDRLTVQVRLVEGRVEDIAFVGDGCAISKASASLMTESVKGRTEEEIQVLRSVFQELVKGQVEPDPAEHGKLAVLAGVSGFPMRVKCATLAWHTVSAALENTGQIATTE